MNTHRTQAVLSRRRLPARVLMLLGAIAAGVALAHLLEGSPSPERKTCAYTEHSIGRLNSFSKLIGREVDCAEVFNYSSPDWPRWERPWFLNRGAAGQNWPAWARRGTGRQLVITQSLIPEGLKGQEQDWLTAGAHGDFAPHARTLAKNLVGAGLGHAIVRLAPEANGTWNYDSLGNTPQEQQLWRTLWRRTVLAMRSVPGAHFRFDWCVNGGPRPILFDDYYPGDDVVDIVGIDTYDYSRSPGRQGWRHAYLAPYGIYALARFAALHHKQLSIPEWGIPGQAGPGAAAFVNGIAGVVKSNPVAYQAYFFARDSAAQLTGRPDVLAAFRKHFGDGGDSAGR